MTDNYDLDWLKPLAIDAYTDQPIVAVRGDLGARYKIHLGYHAGVDYASLCGFNNSKIGRYRHRIWSPVQDTGVDCRNCYDKAKAIHDGQA